MASLCQKAFFHCGNQIRTVCIWTDYSIERFFFLLKYLMQKVFNGLKHTTTEPYVTQPLHIVIERSMLFRIVPVRGTFSKCSLIILVWEYKMWLPQRHCRSFNCGFGYFPKVLSGLICPAWHSNYLCTS